MAYQPGADPWGRAPAPDESSWWGKQQKPNTYGNALGWANQNIPGMLSGAWNSGGGDWQKWLQPNNPAVTGWAQTQMGASRNAADDVSRRMEMAGVANNRGNYTINQSPSWAHDAIGQVARGAGDAYRWAGENIGRQGAQLAADDWRAKIGLAGNMGSLWSNLLGGASAENMGWLDRLGGANQRDTAWNRQLYSQYPQDIQGFNTWKQGLTDRNAQQQQQGDLSSLLSRVAGYENVTMGDPRMQDIMKLVLQSRLASGKSPIQGM